VRELLIS